MLHKKNFRLFLQVSFCIRSLNAACFGINASHLQKQLLTRHQLRALQPPVVGAAALVQPSVRGRATVPQRAGAAAHGRVPGVEAFWALEAFVIVSVPIQPAVTVFPLRIGYPQVHHELPEHQEMHKAPHPEMCDRSFSFFPAE